MKGPAEEGRELIFGEIEHCQNNSKIRMWVCLHVLNTVLQLFSLVFACFWRNKEENILLANHCSRTNLNVYAGFIVRSNKRFFVSLPVFVIQLEFACSLAQRRDLEMFRYSKHCDVSFSRAKLLQILIGQVECSPSRIKCTSLH